MTERLPVPGEIVDVWHNHPAYENKTVDSVEREHDGYWINFMDGMGVRHGGRYRVEIVKTQMDRMVEDPEAYWAEARERARPMAEREVERMIERQRVKRETEAILHPPNKLINFLKTGRFHP